MKCLSREIIFDYINNELSEDNMKKVKNHLESCEQCHDIFHHVNLQIQRVRTGLDLLSPETIPKMSFCLPQETKKASLGTISRFFQQRLKLSIEFSWVKAFVFTLLILIFISTFLIKKDREIREEDLQRLLMVADMFYEEDPKVDWNGKELVILIYDQEKKTVELVRNNVPEGKTSSVRFKAGGKNVHLDI